MDSPIFRGFPSQLCFGGPKVGNRWARAMHESSLADGARHCTERIEDKQCLCWSANTCAENASTRHQNRGVPCTLTQHSETRAAKILSCSNLVFLALLRVVLLDLQESQTKAKQRQETLGAVQVAEGEDHNTEPTCRRRWCKRQRLRQRIQRWKTGNSNRANGPSREDAWHT